MPNYIGIYVYSMHIVDRYSILHYAISFLMKKIASYENMLESYITFLFACYWLLTGFFNLFFRLCLRFSMGIGETHSHNKTDYFETEI